MKKKKLESAFANGEGVSAIQPSLKPDSVMSRAICFSPRSASSVKGTMCLISANQRMPFRSLNIFSTSDWLLAEVTEQPIVQNVKCITAYIMVNCW